MELEINDRSFNEDFDDTHSSSFRVQRRSNGTEVFNEAYSEKAINRLKNLISIFFKQGDRKYYSIHVDGEMVVDRNSDSRKFDRYLAFIDKTTRTVEVRMYKGKSFNCNRHLFIIPQTLDGIQEKEKQMEVEIAKALEAKEKEDELLYLREELSRKERKLKKLKRIIAEKEQKLSIGEVRDFIVEGKGIIDAFRGGQSANPTQLGGSAPNQPESEVEIEMESPISEEQTLFEDLVNDVGVDNTKKALELMQFISNNPDLSKEFNEKFKQSKKQKNGNQ